MWKLPENKCSLMLLTRIHATAALLFEDVIIKIPWRSPCFTSYWVVAVARKTFQPGWWVDTQRKTENIPQTFIAKELRALLSLVAVPLRFTSGESLDVIASAWASDGGTTCSAGIQVGHKFHNASKSQQLSSDLPGCFSTGECGLVCSTDDYLCI